ncbi:TetR/AcrR family transcriptional regulator [Dickeya dianthicola]|uniref:TetR/AcrR family transcriptional regulator n=1 Tax=Dickeya dianthicola TaxID=204039 RepID=UPI0003A842F7|nr:TetR family transcriptional regulator [Dickeya dianthicola]MCI4032524.1 TetR family transcriptional regulator [Dickeya dianthicola]MCI4172151.1 TetR family transcriptional regulator [Dickeya dianthicola]MCI4175808.1 TetR family transcriptional regulator [Dickeya dianthicola]MCI4182367.1 TetR family transcriptional regulator [Dickeya dianthicola]MCI4195896.1 TetR family transcriptional regulator [Dickeya dianthicola]
MNTAAKEKEVDVRQRILQEAITRFAHKGSELTTVREITEATQVNVAAINYHFGSKDGLLQAVLDAVLQPLNAERDRLLDETARRWGESPPLAALLDALLRPLVQSARTPDGGRIAVRLLQHLRATPQGEVSLLLSDRFDGTAHRFIQAFVRAVPQISRAEAIWRYEFARGAAMHVLADVDPRSGRLSLLSQGLCDSNDDEQVLRQLLRFVSAGFAAPSADAVPTE